MSIDPDEEAIDLIRTVFRHSGVVWRELQKTFSAQNRPAPKNFAEKFGARWLSASEIARDRSRSSDPIARELVGGESYYMTKHTDNITPHLARFDCQPPRKHTRDRAASVMALRRAYEAHTGVSCVSGRKLTSEDLHARRVKVTPEFAKEAALLAGKKPGDCRLLAAYRREYSAVEGALSIVKPATRAKKRTGLAR